MKPDSINREGELGTVPMRSDRFFAAQGQWFFSTREGTVIGPFDEKQNAQQGLNDFLEFMQLANSKTLSSFYNSLNH